MNKNKLLIPLTLAAFATHASALAEETLPVTANIGFVTDYLYRGITQTGGNPAIQGGFDYAHASGVYAGLWGSNVSWVPASSASLELDTYFGFKNSVAEDWSYDAGFLRYNYPAVYAPGATKANTNEIYGAIGWKWLSAKYSRSLSNLFGFAGSRGSGYLDVSGSYKLEKAGVTLGAHYGKQTISGAANSGLSYTDYKLSASRDFSGYIAGIAYSSTNTKKGPGELWNAGLADGSNLDLGRSAIILSVTHSF